MGVDQAWLQSQFTDLSDIAPLPAGGQKWVFRAKHPTDGDVVLKLIKPGQDAERIRREVQAVEQVRSRRVPQILDVGSVTTTVGNLIWIREQRIVGASLRQTLALGPLNHVALLRLGSHVIEALAAAEQVRIVHRDVKPDNIVVDGAGDFWLLDFGLARHLDLESVTATHYQFGVGTPGYAPPEQFRNQKRDIDARADLFGLGVTLYECATGTNPFRAGARDDLEILRRVERQPIPRLSLPWDRESRFADFVATVAQPLRSHRPSTAAEALDWYHDVWRALGSP